MINSYSIKLILDFMIFFSFSIFIFLFNEGIILAPNQNKKLLEFYQIEHNLLYILFFSN